MMQVPANTSMPPLIVACLAATWFVWGSTYLAIKFALESFPPFFMMGTRFIVAGALLLAWMHWRGAAWPTVQQWLNATIVGALMLGGGMGGTAYAEQTVASGMVVAFIAVQPLLTSIINLWWRVVPTRWEWIGIGVGLIGVLMLVRGSAFGASPEGLVAISVAVLLWGLGGALSQRTLPLATGAMGFGSEMLCGGVVLMAMSALGGEAMPTSVTPLAALSWVYLVVFGSLIAFSAYMVLLAQTSPAVATSYSYVNPVIAMVLGVTFGGEIVTAWEWWAATVIVVGVVLLMVARRRR